ncbi:MAG TPA: TlpA disulfide reductase family protein [bacterium]|nr:TlpA disulfide reductase family protein [bacterium]
MIQQDKISPRRRLWVVLLAVVLGGVAAVAVVRGWLAPLQILPPPPSLPSGNGVLVGHPAPDFTLPSLSPSAATGAASTGALALRSLRGKPVLLNFWASWCAPCRAEMPLLVRLYKVYGPRGVVFVGVNVEDEAADARRFMAQYHMDFPVVRAPDHKIMTAYGLVGLPTTVFIGPDGVIRGSEVGGFIGPDGEKALTRMLDSVLP